MIGALKLYSAWHERDLEYRERCREAYDKHGVGEVLWLVTGNCNLRCPHCYVDAPTSPLNELTASEAMNVVEELVRLEVPVVFISGGEPLMRRDIYDVLSSLSEHGVLTVLSCNGLLLSEGIVKRLGRCGVWFVAVPLYGPPQLHDNITGVEGSFVRIVEGIKACVEEGMHVCVKTLVSSRNYDHIPYLLEKCLELGVRTFYICDLVNLGRAKTLNKEKLPPSRWMALLDKLVKLVKEEKVEVDIGAMPSAAPYLIEQFGGPSKPLRSSCPAGKGFISISPSGTVLPCNFLLEVEVGNIRTASLEEIVRESEVLSRLRHSRRFKGPCGQCRYNMLCGGCRAKAYISGDLEGSDPTCLLYMQTWSREEGKTEDDLRAMHLP